MPPNRVGGGRVDRKSGVSAVRILANGLRVKLSVPILLLLSLVLLLLSLGIWGLATLRHGEFCDVGYSLYDYKDQFFK
jgi:hypothetical protein